MSDLIDYLRARLDEEEAIAREATQGGWSWGLDPRPKTGSALHADRGVTVLLTTVHDLRAADAQHIAYWDPARVLADIAAKRAVLDEHEAEKPWFKGEVYCLSCDRLDYPCRTLLALSQPYADRDDFDPAWRP